MKMNKTTLLHTMRPRAYTNRYADFIRITDFPIRWGPERDAIRLAWRDAKP